MKKWLFAFSMAGLLALTGCSRPAPEGETSPAETETVAETPVVEETSGIKVIENVGPDKNRTVSLRIVDENNPALPGREAVKVRGIYISGPMAGSTELFQNILDSAAGTEINTVVIDFKDDQGRITCPVDSPVASEIGACRPYVQDMKKTDEGARRIFEGTGPVCDRPGGGLQGSLAGGEKAGVEPASG